jgi:hypothetical protein
MVLDRWYGRTLARISDVSGFNRRAIVAFRDTWRAHDIPQDGDLVEMRSHGRANHVGVYLDIDGGGVLHCQQGPGVCFDPLSDIKLMGWRTRFWRPARRARSRVDAGGAPAVYYPGIDALLDPDAWTSGGAEERIAAGRAMPIEICDGDTIAVALTRSGIADASVIVFRPDKGAVAVALDEADGNADALALALNPCAADDWGDTRADDGRPMIVIAVPQGGEGSNPLQAVLMIALVVVASYVAGPVGTQLSTSLGGAITASTGQALVFSAITTIGSLAINALLPPPALRRLGDPEVSPTYSSAAQASVARPGAVIPVQFGRHIHLLDDIAPPWARFDDESAQQLHQVLCLGMGEYELEELRIGEITVWRDGEFTGALPGVTFQHVKMNEPVTLFPDTVFTSRDVTGQEVPPEGVTSWREASPAGIECVRLGIDISFGALVSIGSDNTDNERTVVIEAEVQEVSDDGEGIGEPTLLDTLTFTAASREAHRRSFEYAVPQGRYRVRLRRLTAAGGNQTIDTAGWAGLRAILPSGRTYGDMELLAVQLAVGEEIAVQTARRVACVKTRKLPVYDQVEEAWTPPQPTRSIAWAVAETCRMQGRLSDLDLASLLELHAVWDDRDDSFDGVFDQEMTFWDALSAILRVGRSRPEQIGRSIRVARDQLATVPRQLFGDRNMIRDTLVEYPGLATSLTPDRLLATYVDERTWRRETIAFGAEAYSRERREDYFGFVRREKLIEEAGHDRRASRFRRIGIEFEAELETRLVRMGDMVAVAHRRLSRAAMVGLLTWSDEVLTFDRDIDWLEMGDDPQLIVNLSSGKVFGPISIRQHEADSRRATVASEDFDVALSLAGVADPRPSIPAKREREEAVRSLIGPREDAYKQVIVTSVGPERQGRRKITGIIDDTRVHVDGVSPATARGPVLVGFQALRRIGENAVFADVAATLTPSEQATSFVVEYSEDAGATWFPAGALNEAQGSLEVPASANRLRMAAIRAALHGPFLEAEFTSDALASGEVSAVTEREAGAYSEQLRVDLVATPVTGAASYEWTLAPAGFPLIIRRRLSPEFAMSSSEVVSFGGPWRNAPVEMTAVGPSGQRGATATIGLLNAAPPPPDGFVRLERTVTWNGSPNLEQLRWGYRINESAEEIITFEPRIEDVPITAQLTHKIEVRAFDAIGPGAVAVFTYRVQPNEFGQEGDL